MGKPIRFSPSGLSDTLDATENQPGAMAILQNLVPDPSTKNLWQCRPAAVPLTLFAGFTTPGFISVFKIVGDRAYGMISSGKNVGKDEPFVLNLITNTFVPITGVTAANVPTSPPTTGAWTPAIIDVVGTKVLVTHSGFNGVGNGYFGIIDVSNFSAPVWSSTNTTGNALAAPPTSVAAFNGRAYWMVNPTNAQPGLYYSDILLPTQITNANQVLTFDDNVPLTALGALPLSNQLGGIIQSLIVFKGSNNLYQVTGDAASTTTPLTRNSLNVATGTVAPDSICSTPIGLAFAAPDGVRIIDFGARVSDPIGISGDGINVPFLYTINPSRITAACNTSVLRVAVQNGNKVSLPFEEYWYDLARKRWSGPHTCVPSTLEAYQNSFVMAPQGVLGTLWRSDVAQSLTSSFVENGFSLSWVFRSAMLPDSEQEAYMALGETTVNLAYGSPSQNYTASVGDENGSTLNVVTLTGGGVASLWGTMLWGTGLWGGVGQALHPIRCDWTDVVILRRFYFDLRAQSQGGIKIGDVYGKVRVLGYVGS
jgi:hypothetical protein